MTAGWRETVPCPRCGQFVSTEQPIKTWIRNHPDLDSRQACLCIGDCDLWVQRYGQRVNNNRNRVDRDVQYLMLVEVKTNGAGVDDPQRDLLWTIDQLMRTNFPKHQRGLNGGQFLPGHAQNTRTVRSLIAGRTVQLIGFGVHLLSLSGPTPASSRSIKWDKQEVDADQLVQLLRFDLSPDSLRPMEHRNHKRVIPAQLPLVPEGSEVP